VDPRRLSEAPSFATNDLARYLATYVIRDGRLFERIHGREPGFEWVAGHLDIDQCYHGTITFWALKGNLGPPEDRTGERAEFAARFDHGELRWIRPAGEQR
jgi:hypothetical protein